MGLHQKLLRKLREQSFRNSWVSLKTFSKNSLRNSQKKFLQKVPNFLVFVVFFSFFKVPLNEILERFQQKCAQRFNSKNLSESISNSFQMSASVDSLQTLFLWTTFQEFLQKVLKYFQELSNKFLQEFLQKRNKEFKNYFMSFSKSFSKFVRDVSFPWRQI